MITISVASSLELYRLQYDYCVHLLLMGVTYQVTGLHAYNNYTTLDERTINSLQQWKNSCQYQFDQDQLYSLVKKTRSILSPRLYSLNLHIQVFCSIASSLIRTMPAAPAHSALLQLQPS